MWTISSLEDVFSVLGKYENKPADLECVHIKMWDLAINIYSDSYEVLDATTKQFVNFLVPTQEQDLKCRIFNEEIYVDEALYNEYNGMNKDGSTIILGPFCICLIDETASSILIIIRESPDESYYLTVLFRAMAPVIARFKRGVLIHSSGVVHNNMAYMFIGHSGSGKSTVVRLSEPRVALSDEAILVQKLNEKLYCWGSPYGREHSGTNIYQELGGCLFLVQDTRTYVKKLTLMEGLPKLVTNLWCITDMKDISSDILDICEQIARTIPCYELHFELNNRFWDVIDGELAKGVF